jgi:FSR family fosmidomycin resistance protein-like MFS transporter
VVTSLRFLNLSGLSFLSAGGLIFSFLLFLRLRDEQFRPGPEHPPLEWRKALKGMRAVMLPVAGLIFVRSFMMAALTVYLPTFLTEEGANLWLAGASLSILQGAGVAGAFLGGSLSDRLGRRVVLLASTLLVPLLMLVFLGWGGWIRFPLLIFLGFSLISMTPVIMALVQEQFPENRALANGLYMCLSFVIRSVVIILVGLLGDSLGLRRAFFIGALIMLSGIPLIILLPGDHRDRKVRKWFFRESSPA